MQKGHTQTAELQWNCKTRILQRINRKQWKHKGEENTLLKRRILQQLNSAHKILSTHYGSQEMRSDWKEKKLYVATQPRLASAEELVNEQQEPSAGLGLPVPTDAFLLGKLPCTAPPTRGTSFTYKITTPSAPRESNYHLARQCPAARQKEMTDPSILKWQKILILSADDCRPAAQTRVVSILFLH